MSLPLLMYCKGHEQIRGQGPGREGGNVERNPRGVSSPSRTPPSSSAIEMNTVVSATVYPPPFAKAVQAAPLAAAETFPVAALVSAPAIQVAGKVAGGPSDDSIGMENPRLVTARFLKDRGLKEYTAKLFELGFDSLDSLRLARWWWWW